jgi:hypothetical protein
VARQCERTVTRALTKIFNNAVFITLTYDRSSNVSETWQKTTTDFNRYIQRLRRNKILRTLNDFEYLRVFEQHQDGYPHIHAVLLFDPTISLRERDKFVYEKYRRPFKSLWTSGLSDCQSPKSKGNGIIGYILKYLGKSTSTVTLWSQILGNLTIQEPKVNDLGYPIKPPAGKNVWKYILIPDNHYLLKSTLKWKRIKLLMWSRGFIEKYKNSY